ncbi:hypothetical protein ACFFTN_21710 [Aminobacter aganoensis]|uniref:Uncharacterized protein n=1 Tax=Aminobacter aganoensis TaxID=83264 RepID=A0A7X0FCA7_9HYPH|nr:hypothetical protein [Aminobacter aganoensis]MBB6357096.1 hypothetical protein [Aminobacter aganoensis]
MLQFWLHRKDELFIQAADTLTLKVSVSASPVCPADVVALNFQDQNRQCSLRA